MERAAVGQRTRGWRLGATPSTELFRQHSEIQQGVAILGAGDSLFGGPGWDGPPVNRLLSGCSQEVEQHLEARVLELEEALAAHQRDLERATAEHQDLAEELQSQLQAKSTLMQEKEALQRENQLLWAERYLVAMKLGCDPEAVNLCVAMQEWQERVTRELQPLLSQQHRHALEEREAWVHNLLTQLRNQLVSQPAVEPHSRNQLTRRHDQSVPRLWRRSSGGGMDVVSSSSSGPRLRPAQSHPCVINMVAEAGPLQGVANQFVPLAKAGVAFSCPLQEVPQQQQQQQQHSLASSPDKHVGQNAAGANGHAEGQASEVNAAEPPPGGDNCIFPQCSSPCASWRSTGSDVDVQQIIHQVSLVAE